MELIKHRVSHYCAHRAEGFEADFFKSSNVDGGDEWNDRLIARYAGLIPGLK